MRDDFYLDNAEWYAALVSPGLVTTHAAIARLLGPVAGGDVVELGAGVGTCLPVLRDAGADRLFAVEPSSAMRVGLMTAVAREASLMERTTIVSAGFPEALAELPPRWSGAVMLNAIGHLEDQARRELWRALRARLEPAARFVITLQAPESPTSIPWTDFGSVRVGERMLQTRGRADPIDSDHVGWTMEWSLRDTDRGLLERRSATSRWRTLAPADLIAEASSHDLTLGDTAPEINAYAFQPR
jgi:hypothetical protein